MPKLPTLVTLGLICFPGCLKSAALGTYEPEIVEERYFSIFTFDEDSRRRITTFDEIKRYAEDLDGRPVEGRVKVLTTPTDHGFWAVGAGGESIFTLVDARAWDDAPDIQPGQTLYLLDARIRERTARRDDDVGRRWDEETEKILDEQPAVLVVDEDDLLIYRRAPS